MSVKGVAGASPSAGSYFGCKYGVGGINQAAAMNKAITEISQLVAVPLAIDTSDTKFWKQA